MEENRRDIELVQRYLERSATKEEKQELEYRLKEEQNLRSLYAEQQQLIAGIKYSHFSEKLGQLRTLEAALPDVYEIQDKPASVSISKYWKPLSIAASILLVIGLWFFVQPSIHTNEELYNNYFEPFDSPGSGLTRSSENEVTLKAQAYEAYDAEKYEQAAFLFDQALAKTDDPIMDVCLGSALLKLGDTNKAKEAFQHILNEHSDLVTQAKWYVALTYLKEGNLERTKANLWEISKSSTYGEKAKRLLKELE